MIYLIIGDSMASRMDRYRQKEERSTKNESLYRRIQDSSSYSNIEGIAEYDKTNEIDITRVKAMLQNRENYQKQKQYNTLSEKDEVKHEEVEEEYEETKNYDIKEVLDKAKEEWDAPNEKYRSLKNIRYDILDRLNLKATPEEEQELQDLIDTIAMRNMQEESNESNDSDDLGLLDDLKSNTMVGDASSIKKIIDEAKEEEERVEVEKIELEKSKQFNADELDKSFYTSKIEFSSNDFEDLMNMGEDLKKHNILLTILIVIIVLALLAGGAFFIIKFLI